MLLTLLLTGGLAATAQRMDLSGQWRLTYDGTTTEVVLPGTMDTNKKGWPNAKRDETTHLTRHYSFQGKAWYERDIVIPKTWARKTLLLTLERTKPTWLYIDGKLVDSCHYISTPQRYRLQPLTPGKHILRILVDNSSGVPQQLYANSHAFTEDTQTNWNGIIGQLTLEPSPNRRGEQLPTPSQGEKPFPASSRRLSIVSTPLSSRRGWWQAPFLRCRWTPCIPSRQARCLCMAADRPLSDGLCRLACLLQAMP